MNILKRLKVLAREAEFQVIEKDEPGGVHVIVIGDNVVHWWPESRRNTAYVESGKRGESHATPRRVIELATKEAA